MGKGLKKVKLLNTYQVRNKGLVICFESKFVD